MEQPSNKSPEVVAVGALCHAENAGPNRKQRRTEYHELASFPITGQKKPIKVLNSPKKGTILFVMPDEIVYEVNPKMIINQIMSHWQKPAEESTADAPATDEGIV